MLPYRTTGGAAAFWTLIGLFALGEYVSRFRSFGNRSGMRTERWSLIVVVACLVVGIVAAFRLAGWDATTFGSARWPLFVLGLVLMAAGVVVRQWAILTLGRFFTVDVRVHPDQTVVDRGPYRHVRHPSYTGLLLFFAGVGFGLSNWASLALLVVVPTAGLVVRIHAEERVLEDALGDEYRQYEATHRRLVPGIW
jgi:protein-S-isoprenylcysteine O-methyltransferase Ste14